MRRDVCLARDSSVLQATDSPTFLPSDNYALCCSTEACCLFHNKLSSCQLRKREMRSFWTFLFVKSVLLRVYSSLSKTSCRKLQVNTETPGGVYLPSSVRSADTSNIRLCMRLPEMQRYIAKQRRKHIAFRNSGIMYAAFLPTN